MLTKPTADIFSADCSAYHKATGDIITLNEANEPAWLSDSLMQLADSLKWSHKDKDLLERTWLLNSNLVIDGCRVFGQQNMATMLDVNQGIISAKLRTCRVVMDLMASIIKDSK